MIDIKLSPEDIEIIKRQPFKVREAFSKALGEYKVPPKRVELKDGKELVVTYNTKLRLQVTIPLSEVQALF